MFSVLFSRMSLGSRHNFNINQVTIFVLNRRCILKMLLCSVLFTTFSCLIFFWQTYAFCYIEMENVHSFEQHWYPWDGEFALFWPWLISLGSGIWTEKMIRVQIPRLCPASPPSGLTLIGALLTLSWKMLYVELITLSSFVLPSCLCKTDHVQES